MKRLIVLLVLLLAGCSFVQGPQQVIDFKITQGAVPLEGNAYQNGTFLGFAANGILSLNRSIAPGALVFTGWHQGKPFNVTFSISSDTAAAQRVHLTVDRSLLETIQFNFLVNGTGQPIDGEVYDAGQYMGKTLGGGISLAARDVAPGTVVIQGTYQNRSFEFTFQLGAQDLTRSSIDFSVSQKNFNAALFNAAELNRRSIEMGIFNAVNEQRALAGADPLRWNEKVAQVARAHSEDMATNSYIAHKDPQGMEVGDRLKNESVFYIEAAENIWYMDGVDAQTNISAEAVKGWMGSPGHRSPIVDVDHLYSDGGVGIACVQRACYVTMVFVGEKKRQAVTLSPSYVTFLYADDPGYGFSFPVPVKVSLTSTAPVSMYLVSSRDQYTQLLAGQDVQSIASFKDTTAASQQFIATAGNGVVLENNGKGTAQVSLLIEYYPQG